MRNGRGGGPTGSSSSSRTTPREPPIAGASGEGRETGTSGVAHGLSLESTTVPVWWMEAVWWGITRLGIPQGSGLCETPVVQGFSPDTYGESFADVYDRWYPDVSDTEGTVVKLLELAGSGLIIELGIGTGRLALPLIAAGRAVRGVDSSPAMIAELAKKPRADEIEVLQGDMGTMPLGKAGEASLVFVAFNTFFNLPSAETQAACFGAAGDVLAPGGCFVVETFVAPDPNDLPRRGLSTHTVDADRVVLTATETDAETQTIRGQHLEFTDDGVRLRPWFLRFASIAELDGMAVSAGFVLESRTADWQGADFGPDSESHVSIYRKPAAT